MRSTCARIVSLRRGSLLLLPPRELKGSVVNRPVRDFLLMNFLPSLKVASVLTLTAVGLFGQTPPSGTVILRDDFDGSSLSATNWALGTWKLGRTQLGNAPVVTGGYARLK